MTLKYPAWSEVGVSGSWTPIKMFSCYCVPQISSTQEVLHTAFLWWRWSYRVNHSPVASLKEFPNQPRRPLALSSPTSVVYGCTGHPRYLAPSEWDKLSYRLATLSGLHDPPANLLTVWSNARDSLLSQPFNFDLGVPIVSCPGSNDGFWRITADVDEENGEVDACGKHCYSFPLLPSN